MTDPMQPCFSEATLNGLPLRNRLIKAGLLERNPALRCGDRVAHIGRRYSGQGVREVDAWTREEAAILLTKAREHEHEDMSFLQRVPASKSTRPISDPSRPSKSTNCRK